MRSHTGSYPRDDDAPKSRALRAVHPLPETSVSFLSISVAISARIIAKLVTVIRDTLVTTYVLPGSVG